MVIKSFINKEIFVRKEFEKIQILKFLNAKMTIF